MLKLLIGKIGFALVAVALAYGLFLRGSNYYLTKKNQALIKNTREQSLIITTQQKIIHVVKKTKPTDLAGNIKRMRDGKL